MLVLHTTVRGWSGYFNETRVFVALCRTTTPDNIRINPNFVGRCCISCKWTLKWQWKAKAEFDRIGPFSIDSSVCIGSECFFKSNLWISKKTTFQKPRAFQRSTGEEKLQACYKLQACNLAIFTKIQQTWPNVRSTPIYVNILYKFSLKIAF
jgi:hypothetical protein